MIRHAWAEVVPTDRALRRGEWAGVRTSTRGEKRIVSAKRGEVCFTFLFKGCGHVLRLVIYQPGHKASLFGWIGLEARIKAAIDAKSFTVPQPYSSSLLAMVLALAPAAIAELSEVRQRVRCPSCGCVMRQDGPMDDGSEQGAFARQQALNSEFFKRCA